MTKLIEIKILIRSTCGKGIRFCSVYVIAKQMLILFIIGSALPLSDALMLLFYHHMIIMLFSEIPMPYKSYNYTCNNTYKTSHWLA